jgi:hypothetical protein
MNSFVPNNRRSSGRHRIKVVFMGLFNFFKKVVEVVDDAGVLDVPLPDLGDTRDSDVPGEQKMSSTQLLNELMTKFTSGKIKADPDDEDVLKLRGTYNGISTECSVDDNRIDLRIKCHVPQLEGTSGILLSWDPEAIEKTHDPDDDWGDDDEVCVFIGPEVVVTADGDMIGEVLAPINALNSAAKDDIVKTIKANRYSKFCILEDEIQLTLEDELPFLSNPISKIEEALSYMKQIMTKVTSPGTMANVERATAASQINIVSCSYCSCRFNLSTQSKCANCGAAYSG